MVFPELGISLSEGGSLGKKFAAHPVISIRSMTAHNLWCIL